MTFKKFEKERAFFRAHVKEWTKEHDHEFALIRGDHLIGIYPTFESAVKTGIEKLGAEEDFFIEEILENQPTNFIFTAHDNPRT